MTKSISSASSIVAPTIFVIHLVNGAQFLNATCVALSYNSNNTSYWNVSIVVMTNTRF